MAEEKNHAEHEHAAGGHHEHEHHEHTHEHKHEAAKEVKEEKKEDKAEIKEEKKEVKKQAAKVSKKDVAVARGMNMAASKKHCMYISNYIKGKSIDQALEELGEVLDYKRIIPFKGEIPHRHGKGMMSGRYPINATKLFIPLLKGLKGNVLSNSMELEKVRISLASASWASRPQRRGGGRFKRTHVILEAREFTPTQKKENKK